MSGGMVRAAEDVPNVSGELGKYMHIKKIKKHKNKAARLFSLGSKQYSG